MSKHKIGLSIGRLQHMFGDREALRIAKEIGADAVDFDLCGAQWDYRKKESVYSRSDEEIEAYFTDLKQYAGTLGLIISQTHGRITGIYNKPEEDEAVYENGRLDCLATAALGAPVCVMHAVSTLFFGADADPKLMRDLNFDMYVRMLGYAKQYGVKVATETFGDPPNMPCNEFFGQYNEFIKSYHRVCAVDDLKDYFTICMDTGHSHKSSKYEGEPSSPDCIRMLGKEITVLHLNDNDTLTDQHKMPLSGSMNWNDIFDALDEIGYNGIYNMELNLAFYGNELVVDTAAFAIKVLRRFLSARYGE